MKYERHHIIPVSLRWIDKESNILELKQDTHRQLHSLLNMPMRKYTQMNRRVKILTNHKTIIPPEWIEARADMQRLFFSKLSHLPKRIQREHVKKMMMMVQDSYNNYQKITWDELDRPARKINHTEQFNELHNKYTEAQKEISKELISLIKKQIYQTW